MQSESRNKILQTFFVLLPQNGSKALAIRIQTSQFPDKLSSHAGTANRGEGPTINRAEKMHSTPATEPRSLPLFANHKVYNIDSHEVEGHRFPKGTDMTIADNTKNYTTIYIITPRPRSPTMQNTTTCGTPHRRTRVL